MYVFKGIIRANTDEYDPFQIFVVSNHGNEEETRINAIDVIGIPVECVPLFYPLRFNLLTTSLHLELPRTSAA